MCHIFPRCSALVQVEEGAEGKWLTHVHLEKPIKWPLHHQDMLWKAVASINSPTKILHSTTDRQRRMRWTAGSTWLARNKPLPQQLATHNNNQIHDTHANSATPCYIKTTNTFYRASACVRLSISVILTHIHTRLTALCLGLPGWAGSRKVKPIWILLKQETVTGSGISWTVCKSAPCSRQIINHASTPPLSFYRLDVLPAAQSTVSKHCHTQQTTK